MKVLIDFSHKNKLPHDEFLELHSCDVAHDCDQFFSFIDNSMIERFDLNVMIFL